MEHEKIARVITVHKERYQLSSPEQGEFFARLKSAQYYQASAQAFPTVGDFVVYHFNPLGDSQILKTLPRTTYFQRHKTGAVGHSQAIAANFDTVLILTSANHDFNPKRLHRYLAAARSSGAQYAIVLTKADLASDMTPYQTAAKEAAGESCPVLVISAAQKWGLEQVKNYLVPDSVTVFLGSSGVGKSTLVNTLAGRKIMDVNGIREDDSKGRHTTTHRQMIRLENGAWILDTPGMRELGLMEADQGVSETFDDVEALFQRCRFRNCTHQHEPGCAVKEAIAAGMLSSARWAEYLMLSREARRKRPLSPEEERQKTIRQKAISKQTRQMKKDR